MRADRDRPLCSVAQSANPSSSILKSTGGHPELGKGRDGRIERAIGASIGFCRGRRNAVSGVSKSDFGAVPLSGESGLGERIAESSSDARGNSRKGLSVTEVAREWQEGTYFHFFKPFNEL